MSSTWPEGHAVAITTLTGSASAGFDPWWPNGRYVPDCTNLCCDWPKPKRDPRARWFDCFRTLVDVLKSAEQFVPPLLCVPLRLFVAAHVAQRWKRRRYVHSFA